MSTELLQCLHCGNTEILEHTLDISDVVKCAGKSTFEWNVECAKCGALVRSTLSKEDAVAKWNQRILTFDTHGAATKHYRLILSDPNAVRLNLHASAIAWTPETLTDVLGITSANVQEINAALAYYRRILGFFEKDSDDAPGGL